jgi:CelD/BcsL family acetyltransferase involved in cellulose biosynthesis
LIAEILVQREKEAASLIADPIFRHQWRDLYHRCPWATVFQDAPFLTRWYEIYSKQYEPVVVLGRGRRGDLTGLLCMGWDRRSDKLVVAGTPHSEYTAWLSRPETHDEYIESALDRLAEQFSGCKVGFGYLPARTPVGWLSPGRRWRWSCDLQSFSRPIMAVGDGSKIRESLQKKSNRQNLKQFEKLGHLEFQRIRRYEEIAADFDEMTDLYDFRMGALYRGMTFCADPLKKALLRSLYEVPDLLHTTVWRLDGKIISARIGFVHRQSGQVTLGYLAHSPFLAKHSPGRLHVYLLGLLLAQEGIPELDLTAGGDIYKERFATHHDEVYRLTVFFSRAERLRARAKAAARRTAKRLLGYASITPDQVRKTINNINIIMNSLSMSPRSRTPAGRRERDLIVYRLDRASILGDLCGRPIFRRDVLADLLVYSPDNALAPSRADFLRNASERLERGDHVYTYVENGLLIAQIWLTRLSGSAGGEGRACLGGFPDKSIVLEGFSTHPSRRDPGLFRASIAKVLADLVSSGDPSPVIVLVDSADLGSSRVLIEFGFDNRPPLAAEMSRTGTKDVISSVGSLCPLEFHDTSPA